MYDAMGGRNSMASWVAADPPLAAEDYTHFSPLGARKIAELFHEALIRDLAIYQRQQP
jgi:lysophospholipase L1-like esterase